jgi:hypothetical protein
MAQPAKAAIATALGLLSALWAGSAVAGRVIDYESGFPPGAIVISQTAKTLYLILDSRTAIAYPVAVAKRGKEWSGSARVEAKFIEPAWSPPDSVKRDHPELPDVIPGGSSHNPMGARDHARPGRDRHPRHDPSDAGFDRRRGVLWLHSDVQRRRHRSLRPGRSRCAGDDDAVDSF